MNPILKRILLGAVVCTFGALASCNIVGPALYFVHGPPKVEAKTELDEARTHVVFVDDRRSLLPRRSLRRTIGTVCEETLIAKDVLPAEKVIPSSAALQAARGESADQLMSIAEIGTQVGADVVIYIDLQRWTLSQDGATISPTAQAAVKIYDAANKTRLWPADEAEWPVLVQSPPRVQGAMPTDRRAISRLEEALAGTLGLEVAKLYFTYEVDSVESNAFDN